MSCIYKYKGKDYTKEEFYSLVSSSNFTQQEQVKKFAELQERLNNKEFLEGAKNAFESSEELQNVYYEATGFVPKMINREGQEYFNNPRIRFFVKIADEVRASLPGVKEGYTRLYRGNRPSDLKSNPQFTNSLEGIALPFLMSYEGQLSYIDVPTSDLSKYVQKGGVASNAEFIVTSEIAKNATPIDNTIVEKYKEQYPDKLAPVEITPQQKQEALNAYTDYLARVSLGIIKNPTSGEYNYDSKVKDIVYHGVVKGREAFNNILEKGFDFKSKRNWDSKNSKFKENDNTGMFFSDYGTGQSYGLELTHEINEKGEYEDVGYNNVISAILNIEYLDSSKETSSGTAAKFFKENKNKKNIGMFGLEGGSEGVHYNHVVFEPEQIHILSSKADIQGFKEFVNKPTTVDKGNIQLQRPTQQPLDFKTMPEFSLERKREILSNFAIKHGITPDQAYQYINQALNDPSKKKEDIIKKLKECY